ncbi:hypothetical protein VNO78_11127 [Psophocarpus tetragonolobus]|uniref:Uncharacterized protein n=1 Tax=Psophocarpus tetragonolobus TaxID=3891 RepID=A0AAN9SND1_PSOTE
MACQDELNNLCGNEGNNTLPTIVLVVLDILLEGYQLLRYQSKGNELWCFMVCQILLKFTVLLEVYLIQIQTTMSRS